MQVHSLASYLVSEYPVYEQAQLSYYHHSLAGSLHIIVEYCGNGNLLYFLRSKRSDQFSPLTSKHSMDMARQVASGMEHLAARNVRDVTK